ncbi:cilia- and flagella-associated protein 99-like [Anthonomus grandis grandis]|uniref:cilia- and flagella-associated protein 99-like n=1 Tax=Anthonomus grandis grandis TaxID=2921223 RepID=UPI0021659886|nr:cilia- and flagella-associated protein 99-like [Anthonomus grandis grandis]
MNLKTLKTVAKLFEKYKKTDGKPVGDLLAQSTLTDEEIALFLDMVKHADLLRDLTENLLEKPLLKRVDAAHAQTALFLLVFRLSPANQDTLMHYFLQMNCFYLCDLLAAITRPENHLEICRAASQHFEDVYVLERIVEPFLAKIDLLVTLGKRFLSLHEVKIPRGTRVRPFKCAGGHRSRPKPPANTPTAVGRFRANGVPETTWRPGKQVQQGLERCKQLNRQRARELLTEAKLTPSRLTRVPQPPVAPEPPDEPFKSKPPPQVKPIEIKSTLTTTLREASRVLRQQSEEARHLEELIKGGFDPTEPEQLREQLKQQQEQQQLELIKKNHLKGLLSYEEAILAKKQLLEQNKLKMEAHKREKLALVQSFRAWQQEEREKIQSLVLKSQAIKQGARLSEMKLLERKQSSVKEQQEQTKEMLGRALMEKKQELQKKTELIQEIRAIHRVRFNLKEFDPTESSNLGLLCEMSIAELQERLAITKMNMKKELEEKRAGILRRKEEHRQMIENVRRIIGEEQRGARKRERRNRQEEEEEVRARESPSVTELRRCLEEKRRMRSVAHF